MAKTAAERKQAERQRREKMGFKRFELWLHPTDWPVIQKLAKRLSKRHEK